MENLKRLSISIVLIIAISISLNNKIHAQISSAEPTQNNELIIKLKIFSNEPTIAKLINAEVTSRISRGLVVMKLKSGTLDRAQKLLEGRSDIEYISPNYRLKRSVTESTATQSELWKIAGQKDSSTAAQLRDINNHLTNANLIFLDVVNGVTTDKTVLETVIDLINAVQTARSQSSALIGLNLLPEYYSPVLDELFTEAGRSGTRLVYFKPELKTASPSMNFYKSNVVTIEIPEKIQEYAKPTDTPILLPVPTLPTYINTISASGLHMKEIFSNNERNLHISFTCIDASEKALEGVTTTVELTTPSGKIFTGTDVTNSQGGVEFLLRNIKTTGTYSVVITQLHKTGYETDRKTYTANISVI